MERWLIQNSFDGMHRLIVERAISYIFVAPRSCKFDVRWKGKSSNGRAVEKSKGDGLYIDKRGKFRSFNNKKLSRKRCNHNIVLILLS